MGRKQATFSSSWYAACHFYMVILTFCVLVCSRSTPTSTTTTLSAISALSTVAIKDGHHGHHPPYHTRRSGHHSTASDASTNTLEAERADRISRLAGLERVSTAPPRPPNNAATTTGLTPPSSSASQNFGQTLSAGLGGPATLPSPPSALQAKDQSTVGSASATMSVGGRTSATTTWASGSAPESGSEVDADDRASEGRHHHDHNYRDDSERQTAASSSDEIEHDPAILAANSNLSAHGFTDAAEEVDSRNIGEDNDDIVTVSSDALSDGGNSSLVGFGEGAGSTISGPISSSAIAAAASSRNAAAAAAAGNSTTGSGRVPPSHSSVAAAGLARNSNSNNNGGNQTRQTPLNSMSRTSITSQNNSVPSPPTYGRSTPPVMENN